MSLSPAARVYRTLVLEHPRLILLLLAVLVAALALAIPNLRLDASADTLVLEGDTALADYRAVQARYRSEDFLLVTYTPRQPLFAEPTLAAIAQLRDELAALDGVASVLSILDVPLLFSPQVSLAALADGLPTLLDARVDRALAEREFSDSPIYRNLLTNPEGSTTALQVNLRRDEQYFSLLRARETLRADPAADHAARLAAERAFADYAAVVQDREAALVQAVRTVLARHRGEADIFLGGVPMIAADMVQFVRNDLVVFGSGIVVFLLVLLAFIFRQWRWVVLPMLTCGYTAVSMLGYLAWADWHLTVISANFVALLLIITLSITIHLVVRYRELLADNPGWVQEELVWTTVATMFKPCLFTTLTTLVAFASFVVSGIRPVIDFGWMMTIGVLVALGMVFVVFPACLMLIRAGEPVRSRLQATAMPLRLAAYADHHGRLILLLSGLALLLAVAGMSRLEVENRFIDYFAPDTEIYQGMEVIDRELGGTIPLEIVIKAPPAAAAPVWADDPFADDSDPFADGGASAAPSAWFHRDGLNELEAIHDWLDSLPETGKVMSLATLYKSVRTLMDGRIDDIQLALVQRNLPPVVSRSLIDPYLNEDAREARFVLRVKETSRELHRADLLRRVQAQLVGEFGLAPERVQVTGMLVLYNNMLQSLFRSQILTLGFVFLAILAMFLLLFRSLSQALIALAPNVLAAFLVLGSMGWAGIALDMMTITIAAITIGIGVDDTIHYVHRFGREFGRDRDYRATMYRCHGSIGKAMYYTSLTVILGFSILMLSNFRPSIYFGLLTGFAMFVALLGAQLLLPRLILLVKPFGPEAAGRA